jgi:hypothetical protein
MERIFNTTVSGGSFSAYDVMRGGIQRNDVMIELRKQTGHLEVIAENSNQGMD